MIKKILKLLLPKGVIKLLSEFNGLYFDGYASKSYSQVGEDMILKTIFENHRGGYEQGGFYIDVGAYHPKKHSNTYFFYKKGWSGINIDAMPNSMKLFDSIRPRDINIEKPISDKKEKLTYYAFNVPALNTFSKKLVKQWVGQDNGYHVIFEKDIETSTLEDILDKTMPKNQEIDFLSIDVEGLDFMVLKSNNFEKYKPKVILIEMLGIHFSDIANNEISKYLFKLNYQIYSKAHTVIFIHNDFYK